MQNNLLLNDERTDQHKKQEYLYSDLQRQFPVSAFERFPRSLLVNSL